MTVITKYVLVGLDNVEGDYEYDRYQEAQYEAVCRTTAGDPTAVFERTYTYDDTFLSWAPDDWDVWPPTTYPKGEAA